MDYKPMPEELLNLYRPLLPKELFYVRARYLISPIPLIEAMTPASGRIYDLGCGAGLLSNLIAVKSGRREVTGIDLSAEKISIARRTIGNRPNIKFEEGDAVTYSIKGADAIVASDVLHHIPFSMQKAFFAHAWNSLNDGGKFILQDIDRRPFFKYLFAAGIDKMMNPFERTNYLSGEAVLKLLKESGFDVEFIRADRGYPIAAVIYKCVKETRTI